MAEISDVNPSQRPQSKVDRRLIPIEIVGGVLSEDSPTEDLLSFLESLLASGMEAILEGGNSLSTAQYAGMYCLRAACGLVSELQRRDTSGRLFDINSSAQGGAA